MNLAPICLFVYNRLWHTQQTVTSLSKNLYASESELYIFSDGPKNKTAEVKVGAVRDFIKKINGFKRVTVIERNENFGLAKSIITGVTEVVQKHGRVIVLEDDMFTSEYFLQYMNEAMDFYENEERVISIHGYIYPVKSNLPETFFLRGADCWGWATWKRGWDLFEPDGAKLLNELQASGLEDRFNFNGGYGYSKMLEDQIAGRNDSWAIRWYASAFLKNKLTLYSSKSLVHNIGNDNSGTHCGDSYIYDTQVASKPVNIEFIPINESEDAFNSFEKFFKGEISNGQTNSKKLKTKLFVKVKLKLKSIVKNCVPAFMLRLYRKYKAKYRAKVMKKAEFMVQSIKSEYGFFGNYKTWEDAQKKSIGYDSELILEKVKKAILKVKNGQAIYERDSVLFDKIQYSWPLLASLLWVASNNENKLNLIDFGGSLGSSYFQNRDFLIHLKELNWNVIEQSNFVECGQRFIVDEHLHFYFSIEECLKVQNPNVVVFSSVLQYLEEPYNLLEYVINHDFPYIIFDRTTVIDGMKDQITVQKVPPQIYEASYPARFLSETKLLKLMSSKYQLITDFEALNQTIYFEDTQAFDKGFVFKFRGK